MTRLRIVTPAVAGDVHVRGHKCAYLVEDVDGEMLPICVLCAGHLRTLIPALYPTSVELECADEEREFLTALVKSIHGGDRSPA